MTKSLKTVSPGVAVDLAHELLGKGKRARQWEAAARAEDFFSKGSGLPDTAIEPVDHEVPALDDADQKIRKLLRNRKTKLVLGL